MPSSSLSTLTRSLATTSLSEAVRSRTEADALPTLSRFSPRMPVDLLRDRLEPGQGRLDLRGAGVDPPGQVLDVADRRLDGRADGVAHVLQVRRGLLHRREHLPQPRRRPNRPSAATSAMVWLRWLRSTGPSPTCSMIGSKNEVSTPVIDPDRAPAARPTCPSRRCSRGSCRSGRVDA